LVLSGTQPAKKLGVAEVTFGNDDDVIDMQSTMMRLFCCDQLAISGGENFFKMRGTPKTPWKVFVIKRFTLTMDYGFVA